MKSASRFLVGFVSAALVGAAAFASGAFVSRDTAKNDASVRPYDRTATLNNPYNGVRSTYLPPLYTRP